MQQGFHRFHLPIFIVLLAALYGARLVCDVLRNDDVIVNNVFEPYSNSAIRYFQNILLYLRTAKELFHIGASIVGFGLISKEKNIQLNAKKLIFLLGMISLLILVLFQIHYFVHTPHTSGTVISVFYVVKLCFQVVSIFCQTVLIISFLRISIEVKQLEKPKWIRNIVVFLGCSNIENWAVDKFLNPNVLMFVSQNQTDHFGLKSWWYITELLFPSVIIGRLISAILSFEGSVRFQRHLKQVEEPHESCNETSPLVNHTDV